MTKLKPSETINKILISSTSRFVGEYSSNNLFIGHAWPDAHSSLYPRFSENSGSRSFYMIVFESPPWEEDSIIIPSYQPFGEVLCTYLSILYGKRFDSHGFFESRGTFFLPNLDSMSPTPFPSAPPNSYSPRKDLEIELNLVRFELIDALISTEYGEEKFLRFLQTAGGYYYRALQVADTQPEVAFLNLVTCGEILSNYYDYDQSTLIDP